MHGHGLDPLWVKAFLTIHIAAGTMSFLLAPMALATAKGGRQHKRWGMVYLWSMGAVAATAVPMAFFFPVRFLALVAVFSFYLAFAGYRVLRLKDLARGGSAEPIDWIAGVITLAVSALLVWLSVFRPASIEVIPAVGAVFGFIGIGAAMRQMISFVYKPKEKMFWWYGHLGNFIASYIAAWSAFSVVTLGQVLGNTWYLWLWPSIVGVPAVAATTAYYKRKFAPKKRSEAVA
ncbi:hypothetical protein [Edaphobacter modestus]|uniref:Uncharacterized protein n=1 Tax=Edaphobacter modestus TaxID=388466 RepID=A0A4Q7YZV3_9BACT|nr:hypothetical protein [Edaphobacter modestus]RZU42773.1 hypothetical protein BDD14_4369 [Edaphobacter modestus]